MSARALVRIISPRRGRTRVTSRATAVGAGVSGDANSPVSARTDRIPKTDRRSTPRREAAKAPPARSADSATTPRTARQTGERRATALDSVAPALGRRSERLARYGRHRRLESIQALQDRERVLGWRAAVDGGLEQATGLVRLAALEGRDAVLKQLFDSR